MFRARYEDFVDIVGGRLDPRRAMATGAAARCGSAAHAVVGAGLFVA